MLEIPDILWRPAEPLSSSTILEPVSSIHRSPRRLGPLSRSLYAAALLVPMLLLGFAEKAQAIPAFARKTGLRCSACHEAWPKLNNFGQTYKDNGNQIGNDRDSPVYSSPFYWPLSLRITPAWHTELNTATATNQSASGVQPVSTQGFDLSGMDLLAEGVLSKNVTFVLLPSSDSNGNFHFEAAWVRFDNLMNSPWLNVKGGKFELDNLISEKRILTLSQQGGLYQIYHYLPPLDPGAFNATPTAAGEQGASSTSFGLGDNQLGMELMGHSPNNYTRYSVSVLTSSDGSVNLPTNHSYDTYVAASRAWDVGRLGLQRLGGFSYVGRAPTRYLTQPSASTPVTIAGSGYGNKLFTRTGIFTMLAVKKVDIVPLFTHATESAYVALGIPSTDALAGNIRSPQWNGRMLEVNYTPTLQFIVTTRYEDIRNSRQTFAQSASNYGDLDAETIAFRWYPFMTSRAGLALHTEYSKVHSMGISVIGGNQTNRSGFIGVDFAY